MAEPGLRIDKFLWFARLVRNRKSARALAEQGHVRLDGRRIRNAHSLVRVGDTLIVPLRREVRVVKIIALPERRQPARAVPAIYELLR